MSDNEKFIEKSFNFTKEILQAKINYILQITTNFQDPKTAAKTYQAILSGLIYNKKVPAIRSYSALVNGKFVSDFREKANLFDNFSASIHTLIKKPRVLSQFSFRTNARITSFYFTKKDIFLIIKILDPPKAHGSDNISTKMIKICSESLTVPLRIIFEQSLKKFNFEKFGKKANIFPV